MAELGGFELKPISVASIPRAIERAEQYRRLSDPQQAESICLDILDADPENEAAVVVLILAMADQFASYGWQGVPRAREYLSRLSDEYKRSYYEGIIHERHARALLGRGMSGAFAYDGFRDAMDAYERAMRLKPEDNDESILRWNACVRTIGRAHLQPRPREAEQPLE